jgi:hypothetical protein
MRRVYRTYSATCLRSVLLQSADEPEEFHQRVLERSGGQEDLGLTGHCPFDRAGDLVTGLVDVPQAMCLVDDHEVPRHGPDGVRLGTSEVVGADDHGGFVVEEISDAGFLTGGDRPGIEDDRGNEELLRQLLHPLIPQCGRHDREDPPATFGSKLTDDEAGLDRLAEPHFVREQRAPRQRRTKCEERGVDLMRIEVDRRVHE